MEKTSRSRRGHLLLYLVILSTISLMRGRADAQNNTDLVFVGEIEGNRDIYRMAVDGTNVQRLADDAAEEGSPVWSPDRQHIAFTSNRSGDFEIFVMDANGRNQTNISRNNHYNGAPSWSPDGRYIVFISAGTHSNDVYIMDRDGSNPRAVTADGYEDVKAVFTPDGHSILYTSIHDDRPMSLYQVDLNGRNIKTVLSDESEEYDTPAISPDGQHLAYVVTRYDTRGNTSAISIANLDGHNASVVTEIEDAFVTSLSWSPRGDELVYTVKDTPNKSTQLYAIHIDNGASRSLSVETNVAYDASWSSYEGVITAADNSVMITAPGDFQSELGCQDWAPDCVLSRLEDFDGDGIYIFSTQAIPKGKYEVKVALNGSWDENYGLDGVRDGPNIPFIVSEPNMSIVFKYYSVQHRLEVGVLDAFITAPGDFQSELGCQRSMGVEGDWAPECALSRLEDPDGDGIYTFSTRAIPVGDYEVKVALNGSWDENYGLDGIRDGPNISFSVPRSNVPVVFTYDSFTHKLMIDVNS